jgi:hypothetical protein
MASGTAGSTGTIREHPGSETQIILEKLPLLTLGNLQRGTLRLAKKVKIMYAVAVVIGPTGNRLQRLTPQHSGFGSFNTNIRLHAYA